MPWRPIDARAAGPVLCMLGLLVAAPVWAAGRPVNFTAPDGTPLAAMFYEASPAPAPAVVLVHMLGRSRDDWALFASRLQEAGVSALALDLRGHGRSGGSPADLAAMAGDVQGALTWLSSQPGVRPAALALAGASLGANLAALAMANSPLVRAAALISPSLEYRSVRVDAAVMKKIGDRPLWLMASTADPYALRSVKELAAQLPSREQQLSSVRAHGTALLNADHDLARALVDWFRQRLIF